MNDESTPEIEPQIEEAETTSEAQASPEVEAPSSQDSEMNKWIEGAKIMGYQDRLEDNQTMEDLYRQMHGIEEAEAPVVDETELEVPEIDADASLEIEEPTEPEAPEARPSAEAWAEWSAEIDSTGTVSDETREAIKSGFGFDDSVIDTFMAGRRALQREAYASAAPLVGGEENLKSILEWAGQNLTPEQRTANNAALAGPQRDTVLLGLKAQYDSANPTKVAKSSEPTQVKGKSVQPTTIEGFSSQQEMSQAINSRQYKTDPAFREQVAERIAKSNFLF